MKVERTKLPEVVVIEPRVFRDPRGFFLESFNAARYREEAGIEATFVQDNHAGSVERTLRGLHAQRAFPQGKLVRAIEGEVWDVAIDIRRGSPNFGEWVAVTLSAENFRQLWIPPGFAHGYCVLGSGAQVEYKVTDFYRPEDELGILWNDPEIGIEWPIEDPLISKKDAAAKPLSEVLDLLPEYGKPSR